MARQSGAKNIGSDMGRLSAQYNQFTLISPSLPM